VNGNRPLDEQYYGILNLFDNGRHIINNINYTYWLTDAAPQHWIKLSFDRAVDISSVVIETTGSHIPQNFGFKMSRADNEHLQTLKHFSSIPIKGSVTSYDLPRPVEDVHEIEILFPGPEMIEVAEVYVYGSIDDVGGLVQQQPHIGISDPVRNVVFKERLCQQDDECVLFEPACCSGCYPSSAINKDYLNDFELKKNMECLLFDRSQCVLKDCLAMSYEAYCNTEGLCERRVNCKETCELNAESGIMYSYMKEKIGCDCPQLKSQKDLE
jgi:hypothetical protein